MKASARLRELLTREAISKVAGAHDGLSALLIEQSGYDAVWASSFTISAARGLPDISLLTMTDYLSATTEMAMVCDLPVLADCDTGFGGPANVAHLVERYEVAGIAGICIEDKVFPKTNSFVDAGQELLDADEFCRKIRAGTSARKDDCFVVVARTEALIAGASVEEALERGERYADAGADALLVHSKRTSAAEIVDFLRSWTGRVPVIVVPTTYYGWEADEAERAGAAMVVYANHALRASVQSMAQVLKEIRVHGGSATVESRISSVREIFTLTHLEHWLKVADS